MTGVQTCALPISLRFNPDDERDPADEELPSRELLRACLGMTTLDPNAMCVGSSSCRLLSSESLNTGVEGGGRPAFSLDLISVCQSLAMLMTS